MARKRQTRRTPPRPTATATAATIRRARVRQARKPRKPSRRQAATPAKTPRPPTPPPAPERPKRRQPAKPPRRPLMPLVERCCQDQRPRAWRRCRRNLAQAMTRANTVFSTAFQDQTQDTANPLNADPFDACTALLNGLGPARRAARNPARRARRSVAALRRHLARPRRHMLMGAGGRDRRRRLARQALPRSGMAHQSRISA